MGSTRRRVGASCSSINLGVNAVRVAPLGGGWGGEWAVAAGTSSCLESSYESGNAENVGNTVTLPPTLPPPKSTNLPAILVGLTTCASPPGGRNCEGAPGVSVGGRDVLRRRARYLDIRVVLQDALVHRHAGPALEQHAAELAAFGTALFLRLQERGRLFVDNVGRRRRGSIHKRQKTGVGRRRALARIYGGDWRRRRSGVGSGSAGHQAAVAFVRKVSEAERLFLDLPVYFGFGPESLV